MFGDEKAVRIARLEGFDDVGIDCVRIGRTIHVRIYVEQCRAPTIPGVIHLVN